MNYVYSLESLREHAQHEPRSILVDTAWSPNTDPFFREDELREVNQVLTKFFAESQAPSYIINMPHATDIDPQDGAVAGPSGLCKQRSQKDAGPSASKNQHSDSQVSDICVTDAKLYDKEEAPSNVSFCDLSHQ